MWKMEKIAKKTGSASAKGYLEEVGISTASPTEGTAFGDVKQPCSGGGTCIRGIWGGKLESKTKTCRLAFSGNESEAGESHHS